VAVSLSTWPVTVIWRSAPGGGVSAGAAVWAPAAVLASRAPIARLRTEKRSGAGVPG